MVCSHTPPKVKPHGGKSLGLSCSQLYPQDHVWHIMVLGNYLLNEGVGAGTLVGAEPAPWSHFPVEHSVPPPPGAEPQSDMRPSERAW